MSLEALEEVDTFYPLGRMIYAHEVSSKYLKLLFIKSILTEIKIVDIHILQRLGATSPIGRNTATIKIGNFVVVWRLGGSPHPGKSRLLSAV